MIGYAKAAISAIARTSTAINKPLHIQIGVSTYCNLQKCKMCDWPQRIKNPKHLSLENFKKIVDRTNPKRITLTGLGEPFLNPQIFEMIAYAKKNKIFVAGTTNFTVCKPLASKILKSGIDVIRISIDSASKETYKKIRKFDLFEEIIYGIKELNKEKSENNSQKPKLVFNFVVMGENLAELAQLAEIAKDLGIDSIDFRIPMVSHIIERKKEIVGSLDPKKLEQEFTSVEKLCRKLKVKSNALEIRKELKTIFLQYAGKNFESENAKCTFPWIQFYVSVEGNISPCCALNESYGLSYGNILKDSNAFNSPQMIALRKNFKKGILSKPCQECLYPGKITRLIGRIKLLY